MRRGNRKDMRVDNFDTRKILFISGSVLVIGIIAFVVTFFVYGNKTKPNTNLARLNTDIIESYGENTESTSSEFGRTVNEMQNNVENEMGNVEKYAVNTSNVEQKSINENKVADNTKNNSKDNNEKTNNTANAKGTTNTSKKQEDKTEPKAKDPTFKSPVAGGVIREFATDKLVYSDTLGEWITHFGIDIKADKTTVVKASEEGTVKSIKNDPRYGLTVVIEHTNGFTSIYSNLLTAEFVVEGEKVKQGQTIGTVGTTATFEIADEPHLHFEIKKDGKNVDPSLYMKK